MSDVANPPTVLIVAGEASADVYGAEVIRAVAAARPDVSFWGTGGRAMREAGCECIVWAEEMAVAGLTEVLTALPRLWQRLWRLSDEARKRRPAVALLIDLPDFNLRLAARLRRLGVRVVYYVSPQVWAWRQGRAKTLSGLCDRLLCIVPFEPEFLRARGVAAEYVGHPLCDALLPNRLSRNDARRTLGLAADAWPVVALLPGSRAKEVSRLLPVMLGAFARVHARWPQARALVPVASTVARAQVEAWVHQSGVPTHVALQDGHAETVLAAADVAAVCSGTATLQAALLSRPMVVVYKVSWLTYQILKRLVRVPFIAMVNLIAGRRLVPELIQQDCTATAIAAELELLCHDAQARTEQQLGFAELRCALETGVAPGGATVAERVARVLQGFLPAQDGQDSDREVH